MSSGEKCKYYKISLGAHKKEAASKNDKRPGN